MLPISDKIAALLETLKVDEQKFVDGNRSAGTRVRKTLQEIKQVAGDGRKDVQNSKNAEAEA
jgi:hypothetical protein